MIPAKYQRPNSSGLVVEVSAQDDNVEDIRL